MGGRFSAAPVMMMAATKTMGTPTRAGGNKKIPRLVKNATKGDSWIFTDSNQSFYPGDVIEISKDGEVESHLVTSIEDDRLYLKDTIQKNYLGATKSDARATGARGIDLRAKITIKNRNRFEASKDHWNPQNCKFVSKLRQDASMGQKFIMIDKNRSL